MASRRAGRGVQHRPVTRGVLTQHALWQEDRLKLQKIVKEKIAKVKAMLEIDSEDIEEGYAELERYFKQLLVAHTKCQMLLEHDEPRFADLVEKLDKSVHLIKRKIIERSSNGSVESRSHQQATEPITRQNLTEPRSHQEPAEPRTPQEQVEPRKQESEAGASTLSRQSIKSAHLMELARLEQLKLEQQYIKKKKQAQIEAELIENELQIAIAQSKLEVFSKTIANPIANIPLDISSDNSYVNDYVAKHSTPAADAPVKVPRPPFLPRSYAVSSASLSFRRRLSPLNNDALSVTPSQSISSAPSRSISGHARAKLPRPQAEKSSLPDSSNDLFNAPINSSKGTYTIRSNPQSSPSSNAVAEVSPHPLPPQSAIEPPSMKQTSTSQPVDQTYELFSQMMGYLQAPDADISPFYGDPLNFEFFMASFHEAVERKIRDPKGCLTRLLRYLKGEPYELVQGCIHMASDQGFKYAKELLTKRYGDPYRVYSEYMKELKDWPKIKPNDAQAFRKFHSFLIKFKSTTDCHKSSRSNSPEVLQTLSKKMPSYLQNRWGKIVLKVRKVGEEATLEHFIQLIEDEVTLVNDPLFSHGALSDPKKPEKKGPSVKTGFNKVPPADNKRKLKCILCDQNHELDDCANFVKLPPKDRHDYVFDKRLCYCCFKPTSSKHTAKTCNRKKKCTSCNELHPTSLHDYYVPPVKTGRVASNLDDSIGLCIVPVKLFYKDSPNFVKTFALLDNGSQGTFIDTDFLQEIDACSTTTSLSIKTIHGERTERCRAVDDLVVSPVYDDSIRIHLPRTYSQSDLPVDDEDVPTKERLRRWKYLKPILSFLPSSSQNIKVGLLIGSNCPQALEPLDTIASQNNGPFAYQTRLGWCVSGPINSSNLSSNTQRLSVNRTGRPTEKSLSCFRNQTKVKEVDLKEMLLTMYRHDFNEAPSSGNSKKDEKQTCFSQNDKKFMKMMQEESKFVDGQYVLPLPFRDRNTHVPNNRGQAVQRAIYLKKKLTANDKFFTDYKAFMKTIIDKGYAVPCQTEPNEGKTWYIPHHGVYHPRKPDKIRVVFDCSAKYKDISLNSMLLQGPDLTNQLVGVLSRFRKEPVGFFGDIEKMFYRVKVPDDQQDFMRFLWWEDGDLNSELKEYRLTVHLQGAISSPSCANFALRKTADDNVERYDPEVTSILKESFYVDDLLKSTTTEEKAEQLLWDTKALCSDGGFNLVQLGSTSRAIIDTIPVEDRMKGIKNLDSSTSTLPVERVLGVSWCIQNDEFNFRIVLKDKPLTRRGILSSVSSIYDPLGFAAPVMLLIKRLLQKLIKDDKGWDDQISSEERAIWEKWRLQLPCLEDVTIKRCFKPENFGEVVKATAHHFSDGSTIGYGQCSYLQLTDDKEQISTSFLMGKSRVAPLKQITVPRMELTAAVTSIKVSNLLNQELKYEDLEHVFWTDSKVVLGYITNQSKSFHVFVANRVEVIRDNSSNKQWNHVPGKTNSSDIGSRGIEASKLNESRWLQGPEFLQKPFKPESEATIYEVSPDDSEVKTKKKVLVIKGHSEQTSFIDHLLSQTNNWWKLRRVIARIMIWRSKQSNYTQITLDDMQAAEVTIVKLVQRNSFHEDISSLTNKEEKYTGQLSTLNPFIDDNGLLRVGGRLRKSNLNPECRNPIILPKKHALSRMIVSWYHSKVAHCGRGITMNAVRTAGYWIVNLNSLTRSIIRGCVKCRRNRGKCSTQLMADLPTERTEEVPPFTYVGVDMFGPFQVKERRSTLKKFVALFTCLNTRAVHLESSGHMDTDHFIMMLRRFIGRRGQVRQLRSDNGTNFVGCDNELKRAINEMDETTIEIFLQQQGGEWMGWKRNPPASSHMGGAWERLIRSARSIFSSLIYNHGLSLNNEAFLTLLVEIEAIINSRPLTDTLSDDSELPLSPINLLTMKSRVVLPPPGNYSANDLYSRRRWRRVQHIANEFWSRWRKEYLQTLQRRSKWQHKTRNFAVGDVVLLKDSNFRNDWQLARIMDVFKDENNVVRSCRIRTQRGLFDRPIHKLVLLVEADRTDIESE